MKWIWNRYEIDMNRYDIDMTLIWYWYDIDIDRHELNRYEITLSTLSLSIMENMCNMFAHLLTWWVPQYHLVWLRASTLRVELLSCCFQIAESELKGSQRSENVQDDIWHDMILLLPSWTSMTISQHTNTRPLAALAFAHLKTRQVLQSSPVISSHLQSSPVFRGHLGLKFDPVQSPGESAQRRREKWQLTNVERQSHELRLNWFWMY